MTVGIWPLFELSVRTPRVELRYPDDAALFVMADLAAEGIHPPDVMPFVEPWTRTASPDLERSLLQQWWLGRGALGPGGWGIPFLVLERGEPVGVQTIYTHAGWPRTRAVSTASWLVRRAQGRHVGREMRHAVLHFAFAGVNAEEAHTGSVEDNHAPLQITRQLGYEFVGRSEHVRDGVTIGALDYRLRREGWSRIARDDIEIENLDPCLPLLGFA